MKVALVVESFDPARGGAERSTFELARQLLAEGHEVHVLARPLGAPLSTLPDVIFHPLHARTRLDFAATAERKLSSLAVDVVHDMGVGWSYDVFQPRSGSRVATFERNLQLFPAWVRPIKRRLAHWLPRYREFDRLQARQYADRGQIYLALSEMVARDLQFYHRVPARQIRVIYNGVDTERFSRVGRDHQRQELRQRLGISSDTLLLLIAAHNFRLKGVPTLIRAVGRLRRVGRPVHLAIAGGKRLAPYRALAAWAGAGQVTTFLGRVADIVPWYAAADAYVQPTYYDPCSRVVLEAMACGLPVVTTPYNGASELLPQELDDYILSDPADDDELAHRLLPLWNADVRMRLSQIARQTALEHTLAHACREIVAVYAEVARQRRKSA